MPNGKITIAGLIKKTWRNSIDCTKMRQYFPRPYEPFGGRY